MMKSIVATAAFAALAAAFAAPASAEVRPGHVGIRGTAAHNVVQAHWRHRHHKHRVCVWRHGERRCWWRG